MKSITALALAAVVAGSLGGCTVFDTFISAGDEALLSTDLDSLVDDLSAVPGIDAVDYDLVIQGDMSYTVSVIAYATDLNERGATDALDLVTSTFASGRFPEQKSLAFSVGPAGDGTSSSITISNWLGFPTDVIGEEISYMFAVKEAAGTELAMQLEAPDDQDIDYQRWLSALTLPDSLDWSAIRSVPATGADFVSWDFGGVSMGSSIIPSELEPIAEQAAAIEGVTLAWNGEHESFDITLQPTNLEHGGDYSSLDEWPALVKLVTTADSEYSGFSWLTVVNETSSATVDAGECDDSEANEGDLTLQKQLAAEGIALAAGYCVN